MLRLRRITFDRVLANGQPAAIPLRHDSAGPLRDFDWERGQAPAVETAVAYSIQFPQGTQPTITAEFDVTGPLPAGVKVQARAGHEFPIGDLSPAPLRLDSSGRVAIATLTARQHSLGRRGVADVTLEWDWAVSHDAGNPFDRSAHRIFTLLDDPQFPWGRPRQANRVVPWIDVLAVACKWADGASDHEQVADAIVAGVHGLGGQVINNHGQLRTIAYGSGNYQPGRVFLCSAFIDLVRLHPTNRYTLDCLDCAQAVSTFASAVGAHLELGRLEPPGSLDDFPTQTIWLIGKPSPSPTTFADHFVSSKGRPSELFVWDACLKIDLDASSKSDDWKLAAGLFFDPPRHFPPDTGYRRRFLAPYSPDVRLSVEPVSYPDAVPDDVSPADDRFRERRTIVLRRFERDERDDMVLRIDGRTLMVGLDVADARPQDVIPITIEGDRYEMRMVPYTPPAAIGSTLRLGLLVCSRRKHALTALAEIVARYTTAVVPTDVAGDYGFYSRNDESIVFARGQVVVRLLNDPTRSVSIRPQAQLLDQQLVALLQPQS